MLHTVNSKSTIIFKSATKTPNGWMLRVIIDGKEGYVSIYEMGNFLGSCG